MNPRITVENLNRKAVVYVRNMIILLSHPTILFTAINTLDRTLATIQAQVIVLFELCVHGVCGYWVPAGLRPSSAKALA